MLRAEARGHNSQLALLRQVSPGLQRIFLRAKRKPAPSTQAVCARSFTGAVLAGVRDEGKVVVGERRWRKLDDARGPLGAAASRGCCGGVRTLRDREDVGSVRTLRDREDVDSMGTLGDREASEVFIPLGEGCPSIAGWS